MIFPVPKLHQLNFLSNNLPGLQPPVQCLHFPFFTCVCEEMEKQVELSGEAANLQFDLLADRTRLVDSLSSSNPATKLQALKEVVLADLRPQLLVSIIIM